MNSPGGRRAFDLRVYLVTDTRLCGARGVAAVAAAAAAGGATAVQVRDPEASGRDLYALTLEVMAALSGTDVAVFVNDRVDIALAAGADGVHLGQSDLPAPAARSVAPELLIGWSLSEPSELDRVARWPEGTVDYLGIGPVYPTATKADAGDAIGVARLAALCRATVVPVVGIGGIDERRAAEVASAGAAGVAVVSAICSAADPGEATRRLRAAVG